MSTRRRSRSRLKPANSRVDPFRGGGVMGERLRGVDWARHPLGPPEGWPLSLRAAVRLMLNSRYPMFVWWGPELYNLYNDAYIPVLGQRHPDALGQPAAEVWREIWHDVGALAARVLAEGSSIWHDRHLLMMERHGYREETYFTFSYSAVPDDEDGIGGITCTCTEETERVISDRRMTLLRELASDFARLQSETEIWPALEARIARQPADLPFVLVYLHDRDENRVRLAVAHGVAAGSPVAPHEIALGDPAVAWPAVAALPGRSGLLLSDLPERFGEAFAVNAAPADTPLTQAYLTPLRGRAGQESADGFVVTGISPHRPFDAAYRGFVELLAGQVSGVVNSARAFAEERQRADTLARDAAFLAGLTETISLLRDESAILDAATARVGRHLRGERCYFLQAPLPGHSRVRVAEDWRQDPAASSLAGEYDMSGFGDDTWWQTVSSAPFGVGAVQAHPLTARYAAAYAQLGVQSYCTAPFRRGGEWVASLSVACGVRREWTLSELALLENVVARVWPQVERARAEAERRESESRFRNMADFSPIMLWVTDQAGHCTYRNPRWFEFTGQEMDCAHGMGWLDAVHPEDRPRVENQFIEATRDGVSLNIEYRLRRADGVYRWAMDAAMPRRGSNEELLGLVGSVVDVTHRKEEAMSANARAERLRLALSASNSGDWSWDADSDIITLSPRAAAIFGVAPGPVITWQSMLHMLDEEDVPRVRRAVEQALATRSDFDVEYRVVRPSGSISWVGARGRGTYGEEDGNVTGMLGVFQEINGRKRAEQALLEREQRMNRLMSLMPAGIYACDAKGRIIFYNRRAAELWGCEPQLNSDYEAFCRGFQAYRLDGSPLPYEERAMAVAIREGRSIRDAEAILERPDGSRWVASVNIDALHDAAGQPAGAINVFLDITERKRNENLAAGQNRALQLLAAGEALPEILGELVDTVESMIEGSSACIALIDPAAQQMRLGAASRLHARHEEAIEASMSAGSIGAALLRGEGVGTADILADAAWREWEPLADELQLHGACSIPILGFGSRVIGAFIIYLRELRLPSAEERAVGKVLAKTAAVAIERRRAEEAVQAAEAQLRLMTDNAPVMLTQCDAQQRITFANRAYLERRGLNYAEVVGRPLQEIIGPATYRRIRPYIDLVMAGVRVDYEIETEFPRIGPRTLSVSYAPDRDQNGVVRGWVTAISDISESKLADAATRQLAAIVESSVDAIISQNLEGRITSWNTGATHLFGYAAEEMINQPATRLLPASHWRHEPIVLEGLAPGQQVTRFETVRQRQDGSLIDVALTVSPILDAHGKVVGTSTIARDITEHKRQEMEIKRREQLYRAIGESIDYGVWVSDATGALVYASDSFLKLIGLTLEKAAGDGWRRALHPDEQALSLSSWRASLRAGILWEQEHTVRGADGEWHPILTRGVPIRDERGAITSWVGINLDISAYRAAQEAVRQGEARFREIADNIPLFAWMADPEGRIYWFNRRWIEYTGKDPGEFGLGDGARVVHPDHYGRVAEKFRRCFEQGQVWEDTFPLRAKDGTYRWFLSRAVPIRDEFGRILRWFGTNTDITDLRSAQEILRQRSQTLETLNRVGNTLVAELDLERILQTVTDAGREISGAEFGGFSYNMVDHQGPRYALSTVSGASPAEVDQLRQDYNLDLLRSRFLADGVVRIADVTQELPNEGSIGASGDAGSRRVRSYLAVPVISRSGDVLGGLFFGHGEVGVFTESSENILTGLAAQAAIALDNANLYAALQRELAQQKRADAALRASERQLRLVTDHATVFLILIDRDHRFKFVNRPYAQRYGRDPQEMLGLDVATVTGQAAYFTFRNHLEHAFTGHRVDYELEIPYETLGPRWMHVVYVPERTPEGEVVGILGVMSDITERKQVEREIEVARDRAVAASRAKDEFLAALSHELRTPLNPVLLLASDAAEDVSLSAEVRQAFATIRSNVELEARLIDDLLDLTRISQGKLSLDMRPENAHDLLQAALATVQPEVQQKKLVVDLQLAAASAEVWGDAVRLQQVFWNVLKNAVKFTPPGGCITIASQIAGGDRLLVQVRDTGIGMTAAELARVFDAFAQGDHAGSGGSHRFGGIGLGLSISRMLVEHHSGSIRAESAGRNEGSTLIIELPLAPTVQSDSRPPIPEAPIAEVSAHLPAAAKARLRRVLLVEDHETTRVTLNQLLVRRGFKVTAAATIAEARQAAAQQRFDLLISDIGLPDGNGYELMAELRNSHPLQGIALSGYGMDEDVVRSEKAGFVQHLIKPVRVQSLDRALAEIVYLA
jgi:PAS domain S-box-containing protein